MLAIIVSGNAYAASAAWLANPGSGNYNDGTNWSGGVVPGSSTSNSDVATFNASSTTSLTLASNTSIGEWSINATGYSFNLGAQSIDFYSNGITSNSKNPTVSIGSSSVVTFHNSSACANVNFQMSGGTITFNDTSNADNTTTINLNTSSIVNVNTPITVGKIVAGGGASSSQINLSSNFTIGDSSNFTYNGTVNGSGTITKNGTGTLTLPNTSAAGVNYKISQGSISIGGGGSSGSVAGAIQNDSNLIFNHNASYTQSSVISGTGTVTFNATSTTNMSASNTYSGGSTISAGIVGLNRTTALGTGAVTITGNSAIQMGSSASSFSNDITINSGINLTFQGSNNYTVNGVISGSGNIIKNGTATVTLAGANTNTGTITISQGTLQGNTNSLKTAITNNASLIFNQSFNGTYAQNISGSGSLTVNGSGTIILSGTNNYSGGTTVSAGTLQGNTNSLQGNITNNANVTFNMTAFSGSYAGTMSGNGTVTFNNTGTNAVNMMGNNNYSGGSILTGGQVTLGSDTCLGTGSITVSNDATIFSSVNGRILPNNISITNGKILTISGSQITNLNGSISGSGSITVISSKPSFNAANTSFTGGITLNSGTLFVGNSSGLGTGTVAVTGNSAITANASTYSVNNNFTISSGKTLTFGGDYNLTLNGALSGPGGLTVSCNATDVMLVLSGVNTYSGATTVSAGILKVNGVLTNNVTVSSFGTLSGSGSVNGNVTVNGGKVIPGGSIGNMTINGNYSPNSSSTLQIEVSPSAASALVVDGTANLAGSLDIIYNNATYNTTSFDILQATTLNGTYSTINESGKPSNITSTISYSANKIILALKASGQVSLAQSAGSSLSVIIGTFMDNVASGSPTAQQQQLLNALNTITDVNTLDTALNQIAPISAQPLQSRNMHIMQQKQTNVRLASLRNSAYNAGDNTATYGAWLQPFYDSARQNNLWNLLGYKAQTGGLTIGIDKEISNRLVIGVAASYAHATQKSLINASKANINNYLAMFYGTNYFKNNASLDWLIAGGCNSYDNSRVLQVTPVNVTATSEFTGQQYSAQAVLSKRYGFNSMKAVKKKKQSTNTFNLIPQINANYIYVHTPGYSEQNAGTLGMTANSSNSSVFTLGAGLQVEKPITYRNHRSIPEVHALIYYDVKDGSISSNSTFVTGGPALSITSSPGRVTGQFGASLSYYFTEHLIMKAEYDLQLKNQYYNNVAFINIRYVF